MKTGCRRRIVITFSSSSKKIVLGAKLIWWALSGPNQLVLWWFPWCRQVFFLVVQLSSSSNLYHHGDDLVAEEGVSLRKIKVSQTLHTTSQSIWYLPTTQANRTSIWRAHDLGPDFAFSFLGLHTIRRRRFAVHQFTNCLHTRDYKRRVQISAPSANIWTGGFPPGSPVSTPHKIEF